MAAGWHGNAMAISSAPKDLAFEQTYICRLKDSTVHTLEIATNDDKNLIKCRAEFTDTEQVIKENKVESQEELKKKEAKLLARDAAEQFNKNHSNWIYEIDDWKAKNLTKDLNSLLENENEQETEQGQEQPG